MFKSLIAEFFAFLAYKNDERYHELELRIQQLEQERKESLTPLGRAITIQPPQDTETKERLEKLEKRVFWERYIEG